MSEELSFSNELIDFIYDSPSAFHAVKAVEDILKENGFERLSILEEWSIEKEGKYYVTKNNSAIIAFVVGKGELEHNGFKMIGTHTDSPTFRIKPNPEMIVEDSYIKLNTEAYGGPILNTWLDRPLSIAGRVTFKSDNPLTPFNKLINIKKPLLTIPNLAIHMNRDVNKGIELNKQKHTLPILSLINDQIEKDNYLKQIIANELNSDMEDIIDFDLFLYEFEKGKLIGANKEFISSSRLDDLSMVHAGIYSLVQSTPSKSTNIMVCFDNEEIGSRTKQGAASPMFRNVLERIAIALGKNRDQFLRTLCNSFIISADMAHALHPNYVDKHDPVNKPIINKGPVIKINANHKYTTDSDSCAVYEQICKNANIPVQKLVNRSDVKGGSTIGPILSGQLDIRSIDIGNPILGMHSVRELGGVSDHLSVKKSFDEFYSLS